MNAPRRRPAGVVDLAAVRATDAKLAALRESDPEAFARAAQRGAAWLRGELPGPDLEKPMPDTRKPTSPVNLRLPAALLDRADALVSTAGQVAELATVTSVTRADVLRAAIVRGLAALEAEAGAKEG